MLSGYLLSFILIALMMALSISVSHYWNKSFPELAADSEGDKCSHACLGCGLLSRCHGNPGDGDLPDLPKPDRGQAKAIVESKQMKLSKAKI